MRQKAVLLAGGLGTRLGSLTKVVNKHLLPVGSRPMILWPLDFLVRNGFDEILIVVGRHGCGEIMRMVGDGTTIDPSGRPSVPPKILYAFQEGNGGIAEALLLAEPFIGDSPSGFPVLLGDNLFTDPQLSLRDSVEAFNRSLHGALRVQHLVDCGRSPCTLAHVFLTAHPSPGLFGAAVLKHTVNGPAVESIVEKPLLGTSPGSLVVTGLYVYTAEVFGCIRQLTRSSRGELEITDVNNMYAQVGRLRHDVVYGWMDAGTPELYHQAHEWAREFEATALDDCYKGC